MLKYLLVSVWLIFAACSDSKKVIVHDCSDSTEANADILRSVENNKEYLSSIGVEVEMDTEKCGYTLIKGSEKKFIEGSLTDIELLQELKSFYSSSE